MRGSLQHSAWDGRHDISFRRYNMNQASGAASKGHCEEGTFGHHQGGKRVSWVLFSVQLCGEALVYCQRDSPKHISIMC